MYRLLVILLLSLLTACSTTPAGPLYSPVGPNNTGVYLYRPHHVLAGGSIPVFVDGRNVAVLRDGGYHFFRMNTGTHLISIPEANAWPAHRMINFPVTLGHNQLKYAKVVWNTGHSPTMRGEIGRGWWIIVPVSQRVAMGEIQMLRQS